jgi:hypothetical protein
MARSGTEDVLIVALRDRGWAAKFSETVGGMTRRHHKVTVFSIGRSSPQRWQITAILSWRWSSKGKGRQDRPGLEVNEALLRRLSLASTSW